jgi:UDP-N-acetyl-2-amino-2-deoxyglucuronate dehydrogenase
MNSERTRLGVGIVGWGSIARIHAEALYDLPDARLAAVHRRGGTRPEGLPAEVAVVSDLDDLLASNDVDIVVVCSPTGLHARQAEAALAAGKHVVVEKPLARWPDDARSVIASAQAHGRLLSTVSQRRFEPAVRAAATAVAGGSLGRPILGEALVRWRREPAYYAQAGWRGTVAEDGGVLLNQGIHVVDLLRWLMGPVDVVHGSVATRVHAIEAEDTAAASLTFDSGALGIISATTATRPGTAGELNLFFEHGSIGLTESGLTRWEVPGMARPDALDGAVPGSGAADPRGIGSLGHRRQWEDILEAVAARRAPAVSGQDGLAALEVVQAVYDSARLGRPVQPDG